MGSIDMIRCSFGCLVVSNESIMVGILIGFGWNNISGAFKGANNEKVIEVKYKKLR